MPFMLFEPILKNLFFMLEKNYIYVDVPEMCTMIKNLRRSLKDEPTLLVIESMRDRLVVKLGWCKQPYLKDGDYGFNTLQLALVYKGDELIGHFEADEEFTPKQIDTITKLVQDHSEKETIIYKAHYLVKYRILPFIMGSLHRNRTILQETILTTQEKKVFVFCSEENTNEIIKFIDEISTKTSLNPSDCQFSYGEYDSAKGGMMITYIKKNNGVDSFMPIESKYRTLRMILDEKDGYTNDFKHELFPMYILNGTEYYSGRDLLDALKDFGITYETAKFDPDSCPELFVDWVRNEGFSFDLKGIYDTDCEDMFF